MAKMNIRKFNGMVRKAVQSPHVSRVRIFGGTATQNATTEFTLLTVDDDPDYDLTTDGTNVAEAQARSRLTGIKLDMGLTPSSAGETMEWMLFKSPDGVLNATTPATLFTADVSTSTLALRKNVVAYGLFRASANTDARQARIRIKRAAMRRIAQLKDGDSLRLAITHSADSTDGILDLTGTITTVI